MRRGRHRHRHGLKAPQPLSLCPEGVGCVILANSDKQTMELGLFNGARIGVLKNDPKDPNMVIAVGHARYAVARSTARHILVR